MPKKRKITAEPTPENWEAAAAEHLAVWQDLRALASEQIQKIRKSGAVPNARELRNWALILESAIAGERDALVMTYRDSNAAIAHVQRLGFVVSTSVINEQIHQKEAEQ